MRGLSRRALATAVTLAGLALAELALAGGAAAQQTVKIGAVYPLSGNSASTGNYQAFVTSP